MPPFRTLRPARQRSAYAAVAQLGAVALTGAVLSLAQIPLAAESIADATPPPPATELVSERTASSRTFDNHDGTFTTALYSGRVHYADDGTWRRIGSRLVADPSEGYAYRNEANSFTVRLKQQSASDFLALDAHDVRFALSLNGAAPVSAQTREFGLTYPGVFPGVNLRYDLRPDGVKETLILANAQVPTSYRFRLGLPANRRVHAVERDGAWAIYMAPHARPVMVLEAPWAAEDGVELPARSNASLQLTRSGDEYLVDLAVDGNWLRNPARRFPVRVDPTITIQPPFQDASFDFTCPTCSGVAGDRLSIGTSSNGITNGTWRSALQFSLADIPAGASVSSARLKLYFDGTCLTVLGPTCGGTSHQLNAHRMTSSWSVGTKVSNLAWDATTLASYTLPSGAQSQWMDWDITGTVQNWVAQTQTNFGLLLKRATEPAGASGPTPPSRNYAAEPTLGPKLEVTYNGNGGELLDPETVHSNGAELRWIPYAGPGAPPFDSYEVHRSSTPTFTPSVATRLTTITDAAITSYRDTTAKAGAAVTYKVVVSGVETNARTVTLPADGQARTTLRPEPALGLDAYITERSDSTDCANRGSSDRLKVGTDAISIWRSLLRFDLADIPVEATVSDATLSLWHPETAMAALTIRLHRATGGWQEGTGLNSCTADGATWYETVGGVAWAQQGGDFDSAVTATLAVASGSPPAWRQWTLTSLVQQWVSGDVPAKGVVVKLSDEARIAGKSIDFYSSDFSVAPTLRPRLVVTYADGNHARAPAVAITKPSAGVQVSGTSVVIAAESVDDRRVDSVQFFVDGNSIGTDTSAPFSATWNSTTVANGVHNLTARATDDAGNQTTSPTTAVSVGNSAAPSVLLTTPTQGAIVGGVVNVTATANDDLGVTKVVFYADGFRLGEDTSSPYTLSWNTLDPALPAYDGSHTVTVDAHDAHAQVATSSVTVTAANAVGTLYMADFASSPLPAKMESAATSPPQYPIDVTVTNRSTFTWSASDIVIRYRWFLFGSPTSILDGGNTALGSAVLPGGQVQRQVVVTAPLLPANLARSGYQLRFDLYNTAASNWFAGAGNKPLDAALFVEPRPPAPPDNPIPALAAAEKLGVEPNFHYEAEELGLGVENLVNVATGNSVVRWTPLQAPGRGIPTVVQLTYNSLDGRCNANQCPLGNGWSVSVSSLTRFGQHALKVTGNRVELVDADGTSHLFDDPDQDGQWDPRPGTHLYFRAGPNGTDRKWKVTTPDRVSYFFDCGENPTFVEDKNGNQLRFVLDGSGCSTSKRIIEVRDAADRPFVLDYYDGENVNGRLKSITDHSGHVLEFLYDSEGGDHANLRQIVEHGANDTASCTAPTPNRCLTFEYETSGSQANRQLTLVRDARGNETEFAYVASGAQEDKLVTRVDRADATTSFVYTTTQAEPGTNVTTVTAPPIDEPRITVYNDLHHDAWLPENRDEGLIDSIVDPEGRTTALTWTNRDQSPQQPLRHVWKLVEPGDRETEFAYNARGLVTTHYDPMDHDTHFTYLNVPGDGGFTADLTTITDANGNPPWTFLYDTNNINLDKVIDPEGSAGDPFLTFIHYPQGEEFPGALKHLRDARGNQTTFANYHANGSPQTVTDAAGGQTKYTFDFRPGDGLPRSIQDPRHPDTLQYPEAYYKTLFFYDRFHRLERRTEPKSTGVELGTLISSEVGYDLNDNVRSARQPDYQGVGELTQFVFDEMDRPVEARNPEDEKTAIRYDTAGRVMQVTRPQGVETPQPAKDYATEYVYDSLDRIIKEIVYDADGSSDRTTSYCYDEPGDLRWVTTARASNPPTGPCETNPGVPDYTTLFNYDAAQRVTSIEQRVDAATTRTREFGYDDNGNLLRLTDELDTDVHFEYTPRNELKKTIETFTKTPLRTLTSAFAYDRTGNLTCGASPRAWDAGSRCEPGNAGPLAIEYRHDSLDRLDRIALPYAVGEARTFIHRRYDANGNLRLTTLPIPLATPLPGTFCKTDPTPNQCTQLTHWDPGWIRTSFDAVNPTAFYDYEAEGWQRLRRVCDSGCKETLQSYYADGLPHTVVRESSRRGREGNSSASFTFDPNGNLALAEQTDSASETGSVVTADYNGYDEPTRTRHRLQSEPNFRFTDYTYDANGNVQTRLDNGLEPSPDGRKHVFAYDQADQLTTDHDWVDAVGGDAGDLRTAYLYFPTGWDKQKKVERSAGGGNWAIKLQSDWDYFDNGDLKTLSTKNAGLAAEVERHTLAYESGSVYMNGNRVTDTFTLKGPGAGDGPCYPETCTTTYAYGPRGNVTSEDNSWTTDRTWTYDDALNVDTETSGGATTTFSYAGNRLTEKRNGAGQLLERYLYDLDGNLDCVVGPGWLGADCPPASDDDGGPNPGLVADHTWDFLGRPLAFRAFNTAGELVARATYRHDALGRLLRETETQAGTTRRTCFTHLGLSAAVSEERRVPAVAGCAAPPTQTKSYAFDADLERTALSVSGAGADDGHYFYARNVHGDPSLLLRENGGRMGSYAYSAYGEQHSSLSGEEHAEQTKHFNPYRFNDRRLDQVSGASDMGARRFSSTLGAGRFLQLDLFEDAGADLGLALDPLTQNRYAFAAGNPVGYFETDGHRAAGTNERALRQARRALDNEGSAADPRRYATRSKPTPEWGENEQGQFTGYSCTAWNCAAMASSSDWASFDDVVEGTKTAAEWAPVTGELISGYRCREDPDPLTCVGAVPFAGKVVRGGKAAARGARSIDDALGHGDEAAKGGLKLKGTDPLDIRQVDLDGLYHGTTDTKLGSAIQKHQGEGNFPLVTKGVGDPGKLGREQLEDILTDPAAIAVRPRTGNAVGGTRIITPDGRGATFSPSGEFMYFGVYR